VFKDIPWDSEIPKLDNPKPVDIVIDPPKESNTKTLLIETPKETVSQNTNQDEFKN
jgi:hypothetical protein